MLLGVDVGHGASADDGRDGVGQQVAANDEDTGRAGAADELVRGEDHRVLGDRRILGMHVDVDVGRSRGVVPDRQCAVLVKELGNGVGVGEDARDIAGGAEGSDDERALAMLAQGCLEGVKVDVSVAVLGDGDEVGNGLPPRQLIAVVLEGADEHHGSLRGGDRCTESVASVEVGRDAQVEDADESINRAGASAAGEDHAR